MLESTFWRCPCRTEEGNCYIVVFVDYLTKWVGRNFDTYLPQLLLAYRTKPHESTGESPFFLLYGRDARLPTDAAFTQALTPYLVDVDDYEMELMVGLTESWKHARQCIAQAQAKQKKYYDKHLRSKTVNFQIGGRVNVYMPQRSAGQNEKTPTTINIIMAPSGSWKCRVTASY